MHFAKFSIVFTALLFLGNNSLLISQTSKYPNEVQGLKLVTGSKIEQLRPLVSTKEDTQKILTDLFRDVCKLGRGDYHIQDWCETDDWRIRISYIVKDSRNFPADLGERFEEVTFFPKKEISISDLNLSAKFKRTKYSIINGRETCYYVYYDTDGLIYEVLKGDDSLSKIRYRASKTDFKKLIKGRVNKDLFKNYKDYVVGL